MLERICKRFNEIFLYAVPYAECNLVRIALDFKRCLDVIFCLIFTEYLFKFAYSYCFAVGTFLTQCLPYIVNSASEVIGYSGNTLLRTVGVCPDVQLCRLKQNYTS